VFSAKHPAILTSIKDVVKAPDLNSRTIKFDLPKVTKRKTETQLWRDFEKARPTILGALYTAVSAAIRNLPTTEIPDPPRLADFALWVQAAEPATGLKEGAILRAYKDAREASANELLSSDIAQRIIAFATNTEWRGTGRELAAKLKLSHTTDKEVQDFVGELRTLQTPLESESVCVGFRKSHGRKLITVNRQ
jgi:hypothetical protein